MDTTISGPLARHAMSPGGIRAALRRAGIKDQASSNPNLDEEVWFEAWPLKANISVAVASALVSRPLSERQIEHALKDHRVSVLKQLLRHNTLHPAAVEIVIGHKHAAQFADAVLDAEDGHPFDEQLRERLANAAQGIWLLRQLRFMDVSDIRIRLQQWPEWAPRWSVRRNNELARLAEARPEIIGDLASSQHLDLVSAAAGCRHLRDAQMQMTVIGGPAGRSLTGDNAKTYQFAMLKLANLPAATPETLEVLGGFGKKAGLEEVAHAVRRRIDRGDRPTLTDAYADVSDSAIISWLYKRALPTFDDAKPKPLEAEALAYNPFLNEEQAREIGHYLWVGSSSNFVDRDAALAALEKHYMLEQRPPLDEQPARLVVLPERRIRDVDTIADTAVGLSAACDPVGLARWFDAQQLPDHEWDAVFSIADANIDITATDLLALARSIAVA
jgi:hypothetical protein